MSLKQKILTMLVQSMIKKTQANCPTPQYKQGISQEYEVKMRDGTYLRTHVYFPVADDFKQFPIILVRSPYVYGFDLQKQIYFEMIKYGFILCYQECRGRGFSEGDWQPFKNERNDGLDTLDWIRTQKWYGGKIGLTGSSYLAFTQMVTADQWGEDVKCAALGVFPTSLYDVYYENGMFKLDFMATWALQNNSTKNIAGAESLEIFAKHQNELPRGAVVQKILGAPDPHFDRMTSIPNPADPVWREDFGIPDFSNATAPMLILGGYHDFSAASQIKMYNSLPDQTRKKSRLVLLPSAHDLRSIGDLKLPNSDISGILGFKLVLEWFINFFYGANIGQTNGIDLYHVGEGGYAHYEEFPPTSPIRLFAGNNGALSLKQSQGSVTYTYDPANPVPTCGGGVTSPSLFNKNRPKQGYCVQNINRADIVMFKNAAGTSYDILGQPQVTLRVASSAPDTSFEAKLCLIKKGKVYNLCQGITTIALNPNTTAPYTPNTPTTLTIDLNPIHITIKPDEQLALLVTSSDFPAFHVHHNTTEPWAQSTTMQTANQTIFFEETSITIPTISK